MASVPLVACEGPASGRWRLLARACDSARQGILARISRRDIEASPECYDRPQARQPAGRPGWVFPHCRWRKRQLADLLVKLYELPPFEEEETSDRGSAQVGPAMAYEKHLVVDWVRERFVPAWASECDVAFANKPISCYIATHDGQLVGFA